jgi:hypothetical protein
MLPSAGPESTISSFAEPSALNPVTYIAVYNSTGSSNIHAIRVRYSNGRFNIIGSSAAASSSRNLIADITINEGDKVQDLYIWTDSAAGTVEALQILTEGEKLLDARGGRGPNTATVKIIGRRNLGTGILMGVAAAVISGTEDDELSAISFTFLRPLASMAVAVDMPAIDLESLVYKPAQSIASTVSVTGGQADQVTCPKFLEEFDRRTRYTNQELLQQYISRLASINLPVATQQLTLSTQLSWAYERSLSSGQRQMDLWSSQVLDISSSSLTNENGTRVRVEAPTAVVTVPSGQQASCMFTYGTVKLSVPFTLTATLLFDADGSTTWTTQQSGLYTSDSNSEMRTIIQFSTIGARGQRTIGEPH